MPCSCFWSKVECGGATHLSEGLTGLNEKTIETINQALTTIELRETGRES